MKKFKVSGSCDQFQLDAAGTHALLANRDRAAVFRAISSRPLIKVRFKWKVVSIDFHPSRSLFLVAAGHTVQVFGFDNKKPAAVLQIIGQVKAAIFGPSGKTVVVSVGDELQFWDWEANKNTAKARIGPGSNRLARARTGDLVGAVPLGNAEVYRENGVRVSQFGGHYSYYDGGSEIVTEYVGDQPYIKSRSNIKSTNATSIAFSDDGIFAVSSGSDGTTRVWKTASGAGKWSEKGDAMLDAVGAGFVAVKNFGHLRIFSLGRELSRHVHNEKTGWGWVCVSDDAHLGLASDRKKVEVWDLATSTVIRKFSLKDVRFGAIRGAVVWMLTYNALVAVQVR
ncbi:MAG: WD40 repeat domain-containing protein [Hyphomonadaceae bacterium]|nr:WD40 repeat domain-containing protein [Hyphomonadaceae bacterium]